MTNESWKRPMVRPGDRIDFCVAPQTFGFKHHSTRSSLMLGDHTELSFGGMLSYPDHEDCGEPTNLMITSLAFAPKADSECPLGMLYLEGEPGDSAIYIAQSDTIVAHLATVAKGGTPLRFAFVGRADLAARIEIHEFTCEYD